MGRFPSREFKINQVGLQLALTAPDLIAWTQTTLLHGVLAKVEIKQLRYQLLHTAARIVRGQRKTRIKIDTSWPWPLSSPLPSIASPRFGNPSSFDPQPSR